MDEDQFIDDNQQGPGPGQSWAQFYGVQEPGEEPGGEPEAEPAAEAAAQPTGQQPPVDDPQTDPTDPTGPAAPHDPFGDLTEQLRGMGIESSDDLVMLAQAEQVKQQLQQYLQGLIDAGQMTPEIAEMVYQSRVDAMDAQMVIQRQQAQLAQQQQQAALAQLQKVDPQIAAAVQQAGLTPEQIAAIAPALTKVADAAGQKAIEKHVAKKTADQKGFVPQGNPAAPVDDEGEVNVEGMSFRDLFRLEARRKGWASPNRAR